MTTATKTLETETRFNWGEIVRLGLLAAVITLSLNLIGMVGTFARRDIIGGMVSVGHVFLFGAALGCGYIAAQRFSGGGAGNTLLGGLVIGLLSSLPLVVLALIAEPLNLRQFMPYVSPALLEMLTFGQGQALGSLILIAVTSVLGLIGAGIPLLPSRVRQPLLWGLAAVFLIGLLAEVIILAWGNQGLGLAIRRVVFAARGLSVLGATLVFLIDQAVDNLCRLLQPVTILLRRLPWVDRKINNIVPSPHFHTIVDGDRSHRSMGENKPNRNFFG